MEVSLLLISKEAAMFSHPFSNWKYMEFHGEEVAPVEPQMALAMLVCIIGLPFYLLYLLIKNIIDKFTPSSQLPKQELGETAKS